MQFHARICKTLQPLLLSLSSKMSNHSFKYSLPILPPAVASRHQVLQLRSFLIQIAKNFHLLHILEIWYLFTFIQFSFRVGSFCIAVKKLDYWTMFSKLFFFVNHTEPLHLSTPLKFSWFFVNHCKHFLRSFLLQIVAGPP